MRPYKPSPQDELEMMDGSARDVAGVISKMQVDEYWSKSFLASEPVQKMERYVDALKNADLDIGHGDAEFGYKMPLPNKESGWRQLIIFRRKGNPSQST